MEEFVLERILRSLVEEESISRLLKTIEKEKGEQTTQDFHNVWLDSDVIEKSKKIWVN
ncbi:MAG TPA: hypothetical protein VKA95_07285 [Nitrososphaeraceae archaeon]|nr:hypothetical protein [Nitrososphaeraceae archaeon]